jgi:hypothetical protein
MGEFARFLSGTDGRREYLWPDGRYRLEFPGSLPLWHSASPIDWLLEWWTGPFETTPLPWLVPAAAAGAAGPWAEEPLSRMDDFEWLTRVILRSERIVHTPGARAYYRNHVSGSLSNAERAQRPEAIGQQLDALERCVRHLREAEDSERTRRACAARLMNFAYWAYPLAAGPGNRAARLAKSHGVPVPAPTGGRMHRLVARVLGWRMARRLRHWAVALGYRRCHST